MNQFVIKETAPQDREWIKRWLVFQWGAEIVIAHDITYHPAELPGFVAVDENGQQVGLITYQIEGDACEIITMNSLREGIGIGTALIEKVKERARESGCQRLWLVTTNDNLSAMRFYQKRGFHMVKVHAGSATRAREQKPEIPEKGEYDIPIRDEVEFEMPI